MDEVARLQQQIADMEAAKVAKPVAAAVPAPAEPSAPHVNQHGVEWNSELHATSSETGAGIINSDGHWRARRGLTPEKLALVKRASVSVATVPDTAAAVAPPPAQPVEEAASGGTQFDADLDAALAEFDA